MRLTKLKLAGFKTFVDPTAVHMPGQLVGVVGPNGCGKSNVIDAVRWVLGESKAGALRGESMQDVIFNGSATRKPVGRASVEMVFDNALGRAAGQWSQYAEISVKRVLDRSGESSYFINNLHVRRRDVIDLFLGTGLGPRAYAIIEQGMISRIIEAKPEELRMFLEEAAGVTKYKDRRRETENRLSDARDNLSRVEDIRNELGAQIERLQAQAEVAQRYRALFGELTVKQHVLWLIKRNEAAAEQERLAQAVTDAVNRIEAETARLRDTEARLEQARADHFAASDAVHLAQNEMFAANAEVARCESELAHQRESRARLEARLAQLDGDEQNWAEQREAATRDQARWEELAENARLRVDAAGARHEEAQLRLPAAEQALRDAEASVNAVRRDLNQAEQQIRVEDAHRQSAQRSLETLKQRRARIEEDRAALAAPDTSALAQLEAKIDALNNAVADKQASTADLQYRLPQAQQAHRAALEAERLAAQAMTEARARHTALQQLQQKVQESVQLGNWLRRHGLDSAEPLWRVVDVDAGWETALEAVLRERLGALALGDAARAIELAGDPPPAGAAFVLDGALAPDSLSAPAHGEPLIERLHCSDPKWSRVLVAWLRGVYAVDDLRACIARRGDLPAGGLYVDRDGHMVDSQSLVFYAPDVRTHGVIERQREINELSGRLESLQAEAEHAHEQVQATDAEILSLQERTAVVRRELNDAQQKAHEHQVEALKLTQARSRYDERIAQIERDLAEIAASERQEASHLETADAELARSRELAEAQRQRLEQASVVQREADERLREARALETRLAREAQEAGFSERECATKLDDLARTRQLAASQLERIAHEREADELERATIDETSVAAQLQTALELRAARDGLLASRRDALEGAAAAMHELETARTQTEQSLGPLRDAVSDLRLKEQAAQINQAQFAARLAEAEVDEAAVALKLESDFRDVKELTLTRDINRLNREVGELGPVNLAALDELTASTERKGYLDAQSEDLNTAIATLEDAIRRIDRETREQLQETYNSVNRQFGELFPQLFGGGEARLVLTGDEILDSGIQVMAHPPGKKNTSIHLLSGGEKALTAIALVFSMFQLNPAPFCMLDEVDAPLDDSNAERFCQMVKRMSANTQFIFISHNKITMEMAEQLIGVTMQEQGCSRVVEVDIEEALRMREEIAA